MSIGNLPLKQLTGSFEGWRTMTSGDVTGGQVPLLCLDLPHRLVKDQPWHRRRHGSRQRHHGAQVQLSECDPTKSHRIWFMEEVQSGWWHIWNLNSNKCLNVQGASTANGTDLIQYTCGGSWNGVFTWWPIR